MFGLNQKINIKKYPYPYIIIENFFEEKFYKNLKNNFPKEEEFKLQPNKVNRMHFDTSFGDDLYNKLIINSPEYKKLHQYIYSKDFIKKYLNDFKEDIQSEIKLKNLDDIFEYKIVEEALEKNKIFNKVDIQSSHKENCNLYSRIDLGMGKKGYGLINGGKGIHVDNSQRLISMIFYLGGFTKIKGGEFRVWEKINNDMKLFEIVKLKENLMIISLQNNISFHDVNPVTEIDGTRNAFYMAISSNTKIWKNLEDSNFNKNFNKNRYISKGKNKINFIIKKIYKKIFK